MLLDLDFKAHVLLKGDIDLVDRGSRRAQPGVSRKVGKIAELPRLNVMSVELSSKIELMLSLHVSPDEERNPQIFKSIFWSWKLTQTTYIPSLSQLWLTPSNNGIDGM